MGSPKDPEKRLQWQRNLSKALKGILKGKMSETHRRKISENWKPFPPRTKEFGKSVSDGKKKKGELFYEGYSANHTKFMRDRCLDYGGGCCKVCGKTKGLVFHHWRDNKSFDIGDQLTRNCHTVDEFKKEINKCILVCRSCHMKIHVRSYNYLVEKKEVKSYVEWFKKIYKPDERGNLKHHIDMDFKNNDSKNVLFLSRVVHRKLHNDGYKYILKIGLIDDYKNWFLSEGVK